MTNIVILATLSSTILLLVCYLKTQNGVVKYHFKHSGLSNINIFIVLKISLDSAQKSKPHLMIANYKSPSIEISNMPYLNQQRRQLRNYRVMSHIKKPHEGPTDWLCCLRCQTATSNANHSDTN